jgi:hypothetical protein
MFLPVVRSKTVIPGPIHDGVDAKLSVLVVVAVAPLVITLVLNALTEADPTRTTDVGPVPFVLAWTPATAPLILPKSTMVVDPVAEFEVVLRPWPPEEEMLPALMTAIFAAVEVKFRPVNVPVTDIAEA